MAIATVTKKSVTKIMGKMWNITMNMVLSEDAEELINKDYSVRYRSGDSVAGKTDKFIALMQADIDAYESEQNLFTAPALDTAVTNIEAGLVV